MAAIEAGRDRNGLRKAAAEFFLEGYEYPIATKVIAGTPPQFQAEARRREFTPKTLPDGYFVWIAYLIWLERLLDVAQIPLYAIEAEGLVLLKQERNRFQASHPPCYHCGMPNEVHALRCRECMGELNK